MNEQPHKRLVNRKRYLQIEGKFLSLIILGTSISGVGLLLLFPVLLCVSTLLGTGEWYYIVPMVPIAAAAAFLLVTGYRMLGRASELEQVEIVTPQNAHRLPIEETLVRPSDLPPSQQPTELLRAARHAPESPPEQLLRPTQANRKDL